VFEQPRPVVQFSSKSRIVIVGQAPGTKVHETGIPWDDPSGDHLREWLSVSRESFDDPDSSALVPMGFCYPGKAKSGDAPPRPASRKKTLTETVRSFKEYGTQTIPLPHPSWRSRIWMKKNLWFEAELLPVLRRRVKKRLAD